MADEKKTCPFCGEEIMATAKKCKHCKQFLNDNTSSNDTNTTSKKFALNKNVIIGFTVGAIALVAISISTLINISQNPVLDGCEFSINSFGSEIWKCPNNEYYDAVSINYRNENDIKVPEYFVYRGNVANSNTIAEMRRDSGEYVCSIIANPDKIYNCNERKFFKLVKENSYIADNAIAMNKHKTKILNAQSTIGMSRGFFAERHTNWDNKMQDKWNFPKNCQELISVIRKDIVDFDINSNSCQMKFEDGTIAVLSSDISKGTIYSIEDNNGVYVSFNIANNINIASKTRFDYTDDIIPADKYISGNPSLHRLTKEEMEVEKLYE